MAKGKFQFRTESVPNQRVGKYFFQNEEGIKEQYQSDRAKLISELKVENFFNQLICPGVPAIVDLGSLFLDREEEWITDLVHSCMNFN